MPAPRAPAVDWKRNLAALWVAEFTAIFGFSFSFPVLSILLNRDLGVRDPHALALWTGLAIGSAGLGMAIFSPVWGALADRYGRRPMVLRSLLGGGLTVGLVGFAQAAYQVAGLRFLQGTFSGTVTAANSMVVAETPREKMSWAFGILNSAVAIAGAIAPLAGGLAASVIGERNVFMAAGVLLVLAAAPVLVFARESPVEKTPAQRGSTVASLRAAGPDTLRTLVVLVAAQGLLQFTWSGDQQLVVLRLLRLDAAHAASLAGLAFTAAGVGTTAAALFYARIIRRSGYRRLAIAAAVLMTAATLSLAVSSSVFGIVAAVAAAGALFGMLTPCLGSMLALESPRQIQSTLFGLNASALAAGSALGPFLTGAVSAVFDTSAGLVVSGLGTAAFALLMLLRGREPAAA